MHALAKEEGNIIRVDVSGKLTQDDYDKLIPSWESAIARYGKMRLLFVMREFHGWDLNAAWDDFRFDRDHGSQIEKVAMVGEKEWQQWISRLGALFAHTNVRYFDIADVSEAKRWLAEA